MYILSYKFFLSLVQSSPKALHQRSQKRPFLYCNASLLFSKKIPPTFELIFELYYSILKKKELFVLSLFSVLHDLFWPDLPKSLAKKLEAREPEGVVKICYDIVACSLFKRAGNSN